MTPVNLRVAVLGHPVAARGLIAIMALSAPTLDCLGNDLVHDRLGVEVEWMRRVIWLRAAPRRAVSASASSRARVSQGPLRVAAATALKNESSSGSKRRGSAHAR